MDNATQHKKALTGPHVRLVGGIGIIVLITAVFLYIYAKRKQNAAGSDTSAGSLGSGQSGSAWDSLTYNLNYSPASSGSTNNPGAPGTPASSPSSPGTPATPSTPGAPTPTGTPAHPASGNGSAKVVRKSTKTAPAHSGGHASPAHPAKSQRTGITNLTKATAGAGSVIAARSSSSAAPKSSNAVTALNAPGGVYQTPILGGLLRQLTSN